MTPQGRQAGGRFNVLAAWHTELRDIFHATYRESGSRPLYLHHAAEYLERARPLLESDDVPAIDRLLNDAERYIRYAEFAVVAERKKRADPATYTALQERLRALWATPVPGIGGFGILGEFDEWEKARDALEDGEFAEASRWCELAERKLPEAIRVRQEDWHAANG
jgi:hypothetical protein